MSTGGSASDAFQDATQASVDLHRHAEAVLGAKCWRLVCSYGRFMSGLHSGQYVSGVPPDAAKAVVDALVRGEQVEVHLMHKHRSGNYESSALRLCNGRLVMVFDDREERA
jgi:hypothetical protein